MGSYLDYLSSFISTFFSKINHDNLFDNLKKNIQFSPIGNYIISLTEMFESRNTSSRIGLEIIEKICYIINQWELYFHKNDNIVSLLFYFILLIV